MKTFVEKLDRVFTAVIEGITLIGFIAMILLVFVNVVGPGFF